MAINSPGFSQTDSTKGVNLNSPLPSKAKGQKSIVQSDLYLTRWYTPWSRPNNGYTAEQWRWWVLNEPIAMICRETLVANILALDWEITPRKSEDRDELRGAIRHYTQLLEKGGNNPELQLDWTGLAEWLLTDLHDIPFGMASETIRRNGNPTGRVMQLIPLDGGTLYPTLNARQPVIQYYGGKEVVFNQWEIARSYISPRPEFLQAGWGMAPPEKVYLAMLMLYRGHKYYADLLLDTPPAGILDLGDITKDDAWNWVKAFREWTMGAPSSFAIPVLYEHTTEAKFIPFGKVPNDIMYDRITLKYAAIVAAAYGLSLSDIGLQTTSASGETLAGSIRQERRTKRTGFARAKKKLKYFIESFLPETLQFNFIDLDDELNVALGRARLATITALKAAQDSGVISAEEHRLILLGDGLFGSTTLPEKPPADAVDKAVQASERPGMLGAPTAPSSGGEGEVKMRSVTFKKSDKLNSHLKRFVGDITKSVGQTLVDSTKGLNEDELYLVRSMVDNSLFGEDDALGIAETIKSVWQGKRWFKLAFDKEFANELHELSEIAVKDYLKSNAEYSYEQGESDELENWQENYELAKNKLEAMNWSGFAETLQDELNERAKMFLGKTSVFVLKDILLENGFDTDNEIGYDIVDKVYESMIKNFDEFVYASVGMEVEKILTDIRNEVIK